MIPATIAVENIHIETADRHAASILATVRESETVALIRVSPGEYRTMVFTPDQEAEAEALPYDAASERDGPSQIASRFLRPGEVLVSVH